MNAKNSYELKLSKIKTILGDQKVLNDLTNEQLLFILQPLDQGSFLSACPGSGKTQCVGVKLAFHAAQWLNLSKGIAVLSFTKIAANEIKERASLFSKDKGISTPHFVGTIDSWIHNFLFNPFGHSVTGFEGIDGDYSHRLIQNDSRAPFLNQYITVLTMEQSTTTVDILGFSLGTKNEPIWVGQGEKTFPSDELWKLKSNKEAFAKKGFVTYADIEYWTLRLLRTRKEIRKLLVQRFPYILIDECQDLSKMQLAILNELIKEGAAVHLIGDKDQAIYEFRKVDPTLVEKCINHWKLNRLQLTKSFRCAQTICDFAAKLKGRSPMKANHPGSDESCLLWEYEHAHLSDIQSSFHKTLVKYGIEPKNAVIVARGHTILKLIKGTSFTGKKTIAYDIATALFNWTVLNKSGSDMRQAIELCGKAIEDLAYDGRYNHFRVPNGYSSADWRRLVVEMLNEFKDIAFFLHNSQPATWSEWINRYLKPKLQAFWPKFKNHVHSYDEAKNRIKAAAGTAKELVFDGDFKNKHIQGIKLETIHGIKGDTYEATLLVSAPNKQSKGGHFEHWLENPENEYNRFAYVACTRPKQLLIVATPKLKKASKDIMIGLGLKPSAIP
ncbi:UvrD-helicase domain-containing protein [Paenibacillus protaetiae]|nr:ATP-dependent helicase [Paenibacillus protaetiae]